MGKSLNALTPILMIAVSAAVTIGLPLALIWSLNTLGITSAAYTATNWIAALLLTTLLLAGS